MLRFTREEQLSEFNSRKWRSMFSSHHRRADLAMSAALVVMAGGAAGLFATVATNQAPSGAKPAQANTTRAASTATAASTSGQDAEPTAAIATAELAAVAADNPAEPAPTPTAISAQTEQAPTKADTDAQAQPAPETTEQPKPQYGLHARLKPTHPQMTANRAKLAASAEKTAAKTLAVASIAKPRPSRTARPIQVGGERMLASDHARPGPFFFAADAKPQNRQAPAPITVALNGDIGGEPEEVTVKLKRGETFVDALARAGVRAADRNGAAAALGKHVNLRRLRPSDEFVLTTARANHTLFQHAMLDDAPRAHLLAIEYRTAPRERLTLSAMGDAQFTAKKHEIPVTTRLATISGRINGSLFLSAKHAGAPNQVIADFANMFAYDIDFQRDIFGGDEFEAVFELTYDNDGQIIGAGDILYGRMKWRGQKKEKTYYRFAEKEGGRTDFYDRAGQSAKRLLMKTPIDGARLSSGFGTRRHPILGYRKAHKGVDFAAARGTPIYAAGDGVVERANLFGSFGNYIRIRHANGYKTAYAHLKGFKGGIKAGKRVRQGDVIGYVGTTGRSTGPHLHYEVHKNGVAVNPQRLKIATGKSLKGDALARFKKTRDAVDALIAPRDATPAPKTPETIVADDAPRTQKSASL